MIRLIGIDGYAGSGKDTVAEVLIKRHGFTKLPFAHALRQVCSIAFDIPFSHFEVQGMKDAPFRSPVTLTQDHVRRVLDEVEMRGVSVSDAAIKRSMLHVGATFLTPRDILQYVGTQLVRKEVNDDAWVNIWCIEQAKYPKVVAPDARFPNERDAITVRHGKNLLVKRPEIKIMPHVSENMHSPDSAYDAIVNNVVSVNQIQAEVSLWYTTVK